MFYKCDYTCGNTVYKLKESKFCLKLLFNDSNDNYKLSFFSKKNKLSFLF